MTYDLAGNLTGLDAAGTANDATFTLDALGRFRTRVLASATDTYSYVGASETVARISNSAGPTISDSIVSPAGDRLGIKSGATLNWFVPDLHGSIAASLSSDETIVANAIRYDAYGQTIGTGSAGGTSVGDKHWTYQGRASGWNDDCAYLQANTMKHEVRRAAQTRADRARQSETRVTSRRSSRGQITGATTVSFGSPSVNFWRGQVERDARRHCLCVAHPPSADVWRYVCGRDLPDAIRRSRHDGRRPPYAPTRAHGWTGCPVATAERGSR